MYKSMPRTHFLSIAVLMGAAMASPLASAQCGCPSDKNGAPKAPFGLGLPFPAAPDMAPNPAWQVYEFERDGVRYLQVNDQYGIVRVAVGHIDGMFWVLPIGTDADRVAVAGDAVPAGIPTTLYTSADLQVTLYRSGNEKNWSVRRPQLSINSVPARSRVRVATMTE
jgi:hypothetical protein